MKKIRLTAFAAIIMAALFVFAACGGSGSELVGTWRRDGSTSTYLTFNSNGTGYGSRVFVRIGTSLDLYPVEWSATDDTLIVDFPDMPGVGGNTLIGNFEIIGDNLLIHVTTGQSRGNTLRLNRVN